MREYTEEKKESFELELDSTIDINQDGICTTRIINHVSILNLMIMFSLSELHMQQEKPYQSSLLVQFKMVIMYNKHGKEDKILTEAMNDKDEIQLDKS